MAAARREFCNRYDRDTCEIRNEISGIEIVPEDQMPCDRVAKRNQPLHVEKLTRFNGNAHCDRTRSSADNVSMRGNDSRDPKDHACPKSIANHIAGCRRQRVTSEVHGETQRDGDRRQRGIQYSGG